MTPKIWRPIGAAVCILCWTVYRLRSASDALLPQSSAPTVRGSLPALDVPLYPAGDDMPKLLENATLPEYLEKHAQRMRGDMRRDAAASGTRDGGPTWWHDYLKGVYYINLKHRTDRKRQFLQTMATMGVPKRKIVRIDAPKMPKEGLQPQAGIATAHLAIVDQLLRWLDEEENERRDGGSSSSSSVDGRRRSFRWAKSNHMRGKASPDDDRRGGGGRLERYALICEDDFALLDHVSNRTAVERLFRILSADHYGTSTNFSFDVVQLATHDWKFDVAPQPRRTRLTAIMPWRWTKAGVDCFPCTKENQKLFLGSSDYDCCDRTWEQLLGLIQPRTAVGAAGYIVKLNRRILTLLRDVFQASAVHLARGEREQDWALDMLWSRIMRRDDVHW
eukprot:GHVU01017460.1.p1 GENE.GHVU01017460.1~~GHVU01017460.1.p1  ORF type:complete len:391 (-),score=51.43 GHVU01017460.1:58-1230(-)